MSLLKIKPGAVVFQVRVTLLGITPSVWRRLLLPGNTKLEQVHECIQGAFGWQNRHLHEFQIAGKRYGDPEAAHGDREIISERGTKSKLKFLDLKTGDKLFYVYDFGDDWRHELWCLWFTTREFNRNRKCDVIQARVHFGRIKRRE